MPKTALCFTFQLKDTLLGAMLVSFSLLSFEHLPLKLHPLFLLQGIYSLAAKAVVLNLSGHNLFWRLTDPFIEVVY